jgi:hypothetical protein
VYTKRYAPRCMSMESHIEEKLKELGADEEFD